MSSKMCTFKSNVEKTEGKLTILASFICKCGNELPTGGPLRTYFINTCRGHNYLCLLSAAWSRGQSAGYSTWFTRWSLTRV